ncbi:MAG: WD40 repeat domain-containing protein [Ignavibacteria bacterium]
MKFLSILLLFILFTSLSSAQEPVILSGNKGNINSVAFSPDSKTIASGDEKGNLIFWDVSTGSKTYSLETGSNITSINYSPESLGLLIYTSFNGEVTIMKANSKEIVKNFKKNDNAYYAIFSPDGKQFAVAFTREPTEKDKDKGIRINYFVDIHETGKFQRTKTLRLTNPKDFESELFGSELFESYRFNAFNCDFSSDGKYLAAGSLGKNIPIYSFEYNKFAPTYKGHSNRVFFVTFSPDGNYLASASKDETAKLWNIGSGNTILTLKGHTDDVNSAAFSPDSKYLATASDDETVKIWDVKTTKLITTLTGFNSDVLTVKFSPDGKYFAAGGVNEKVLLWETSSIFK